MQRAVWQRSVSQDTHPGPFRGPAAGAVLPGIVDRTSKTYDFDWVFREDSTQRMLFKTTALPTLENVFAGYCGAVMAYGQTGTGKTHTARGTAPAPRFGVHVSGPGLEVT